MVTFPFFSMRLHQSLCGNQFLGTFCIQPTCLDIKLQCLSAAKYLHLAISLSLLIAKVLCRSRQYHATGIFITGTGHPAYHIREHIHRMAYIACPVLCILKGIFGVRRLFSSFNECASPAPYTILFSKSSSECLTISFPNSTLASAELLVYRCGISPSLSSFTASG